MVLSLPSGITENASDAGHPERKESKMITRQKVTNADIAAILYEISDIFKLKGTSFRSQAYYRAARNIETLDEDITDIHGRGANSREFPAWEFPSQKRYGP